MCRSQYLVSGKGKVAKDRTAGAFAALQFCMLRAGIPWTRVTIHNSGFGPTGLGASLEKMQEKMQEIKEVRGWFSSPLFPAGFFLLHFLLFTE